MNFADILRNFLGIAAFVFFAFWAYRSLVRTHRMPEDRKPGWGVSSMLFGIAMLCLFAGLSESVVFHPLFVILWNLVTWLCVLFGVLLALLSLLEVSQEESVQAQKRRRDVFRTIGLALVFFLGLGGAVFERFGEITPEGKLRFDFSALEEAAQKPSSSGDHLNSASQFYRSSHYYYSVRFEGTGWKNWKNVRVQKSDAAFGLRKGESGRFLVIPVTFLTGAPPMDLFMTAILNSLEIDLNSPGMGRWERHAEGGYEGYVINFEKRVQKAEQRYRLKLLYGGQFGYLVAAWADSTEPEIQDGLDSILERFELGPPPYQPPKPSAMSPAERLRHSHFYNAVGTELVKRGKPEEAVPYFKLAQELMPKNITALRNLLTAYLRLGNYAAASELLAKHGEKIPRLGKLGEMLQKIRSQGWKEDSLKTLSSQLSEAGKAAERAVRAEPGAGTQAPSAAKPDESAPEKSGQTGLAESSGRKKTAEETGEQRPRGKKAPAGGPSGTAKTLPLEKIQLPPGFHIQLYAANVPGARQMALGPRGTVFVGTRDVGRVYAVRDKDGDHRAEDIVVVAQNLTVPSGVAVRGGALYIAALNQILRIEDIEDHLEALPPPRAVFQGLPAESYHGWRYLRFGPDGQLYVSVGAPCNICRKKENIYASIVRLRPDDKKIEVYAEGVRDALGMEWHPDTRELWFTDIARDGMGEDGPADELNRAPRSGLHFGFPFCHGRAVADPEFGTQKSCSEFTPPALELDRAVAASGIRFYTGNMFPPEFHHRLFIAEHGFQSMKQRHGYRIMQVHFESGRPSSYDVFAEGWLGDGRAWGRPTDLLVMPDGALLVSDDEAGVLYRIAYGEN